MSKWNLIFDADRCNNCNNCILVVKDEYVGNAHEGYSAPMPETGTLWLTVTRHERGTAPMIDVSHYVETCMNCRNPACVNDQTAGIVSQREDGIVLIDPAAAKGRKDIVGMCPHGNIHWNEKAQIPQKWTWDAHLLDAGWKEPRPSQVCPTRALVAEKAEDATMEARVAAGELSQRVPGARLYDRNFDRVTTSFLGGTLVRSADGIEDCAEGLTVTLRKDGAVIATQETDAFGEFKFDGLAGKGEAYELVIPGAGPRDIVLKTSTYIGVIAV
ncbi:MAG: 4Fe-4S dicluster domain-containing protein [Pseudomonadota bacterium]